MLSISSAPVASITVTRRKSRMTTSATPASGSTRSISRSALAKNSAPSSSMTRMRCRAARTRTASSPPQTRRDGRTLPSTTLRTSERFMPR